MALQEVVDAARETRLAAHAAGQHGAAVQAIRLLGDLGGHLDGKRPVEVANNVLVITKEGLVEKLARIFNVPVPVGELPAAAGDVVDAVAVPVEVPVESVGTSGTSEPGSTGRSVDRTSESF